MKTELKSEGFYAHEDLTAFVNENKITKENIQAITVNLRSSFAPYVLFYWEVTE